MGWVIDLLGSQYHWSKKDILENVFIDDLFVYIKNITKRKIDDIKLQLAIVQNPHTKNPQELWKKIEFTEKQIPGQRKDDKFDPIGFEILKSKLRQNPRFVVKS